MRTQLWVPSILVAFCVTACADAPLGDPAAIASAGSAADGPAPSTGGVSDPASAAATPNPDEPPASLCPALVTSTEAVPPDLAPVAGCPCTRRPGPGGSYLCPSGAGASVSATVGPEGGRLSLVGQQGKGVPFVLEIPPGALKAPVTVTVTETAVSPPTGFVDYSPVYLVEPRGLPLDRIATLQVPWSSNSNTVPPELALYQRLETEGCDFKPMVDSYTNAGFQMASLTRLGYLFVGVEKSDLQATCP